MSGFLHSKKFWGLVILLILLFILIPLVLIFIVNPIKQKQATQSGMQKTQTTAFESTTKLADFNGSPIYIKDLNALALEQYGTSDAKSLNTISLNNLLKTYVERKILDKQNLGDVSAQAAKIEKAAGIGANQAKYQALREKFTATASKSWSLYSIDFWIPPTNADGSFIGVYPSEQKQTNADRLKLVSDVNNALIYAQTEMQRGTSVFNIATQIVKNYPSLSAILAINGAKFSNSTVTSLWNSPTTFYYDKTNAVSDPFYKTVYTMTENSPVTKVLNDNNTGGHVVKVVKVNNPTGILDNYQDWLKNQESGLKIINTAILKLESTR